MKKLSRSEMKNVMGGNPSGPGTTACNVSCKDVHASQVSGWDVTYLVSVGSCPSSFVCAPGDEVYRECACTTVGSGGGAPGSNY